MRKFNIMEYIYALKFHADEGSFFAFYTTLNKAKSAVKDMLAEANKKWDNPIVYIPQENKPTTVYKLGLDIYEIQLETTDNCSMRYVTCIFAR